ncbi:MAG: hypothetical protein KDA91_14290 [Planctomycetaceae bacterium]|nr:hypothetical protein [Planctomycetaceae bacterium]
MIYPMQCCSVPQFGVPMFTDALGWTTRPPGYLSLSMDWAVSWTRDLANADDLSPAVTFTSEINTSTPFNPLSWLFSEGRDPRTYRTLSPDCYLSPTALTGIALQTHLWRRIQTTSGVTMKGGMLPPSEYQVFLNGTDISGVVTIDPTDPPGDASGFPLSVNLPNYSEIAYDRSTLEVMCKFRFPVEPGSTLEMYLIPWGAAFSLSATNSPCLFCDYETENDTALVSVEKVSGAAVDPTEVDASWTDRLNLSGLWLPTGSDAIPIQAPWFPSGGANTPTVGFWQRNEATFSKALNGGTPQSVTVRPV